MEWKLGAAPREAIVRRPSLALSAAAAAFSCACVRSEPNER